MLQVVEKAEKNKPWFVVPVAPATMKKVLDACHLNPDVINENVRVLDFGCGSGRYMMGFLPCISAENLFGVDADATAVTIAQEAGLQCLTLDPAVAKLDFPDQYFDIVFSSNVIEHIPHKLYKIYLAEIHRVLKPGGLFAVGAPNYPIKRLYDIGKARRQKTWDDKMYYLFDDPTHCNRQSIFKVERDLAQYFVDINLMPSTIFFEKKFKWLRKDDVRYRLRGFGNKFFGTCRKPV